MATKSNNIIDTRVQLKNDTEARWNVIANTFVPMKGEAIIYSTDLVGHEYPRIKIGDGSTTLASLPFIVNGEYETISQYATYNDFPQPGMSNKLYIDLSTNNMYYHSSTQGYRPLTDLVLGVRTDTIKKTVSWSPGSSTKAEIKNHALVITNGFAPSLITSNMTVVTSVTTGGNS